MYAVIVTGGKQYKVQVGDSIYVEKLAVEDGATIDFNAILFADEGDIRIGTPLVDGVSVQARVVRQAKGKKLYIGKFKAKKNYRRKIGHRQPYTQIEIVSIAH